MEKIRLSKKQINFKEKIEKYVIKYVIEFKADFDKSILNNFSQGLTLNTEKAQINDIEKILTESKLTYKSYYNFLFVLFKNSYFTIKISNVKKKLISFLRMEISLDFRNMLQNFRYLLNILYNKMYKRAGYSKELLNFNFKYSDPFAPYPRITSYPELRKFFDLIIPKLNEYNKNFLYYSKKYAELSIKINYKEVILDLWNYFIQQKYVEAYHKVKKNKIISYDLRLNKIFSRLMWVGTILIVIFILMLFEVIPVILNLNFSFWIVLAIPLIIILIIADILKSKKEKNIRNQV